MSKPTNGENFTTELEDREIDLLEKYALRSRERRTQLGNNFRKYKPRAPLEYRTEYHRDRDRILWSKTFKRLQHKTQVFPHYVEDHYKRRLTHSLEVSQVAGTVARSLRLNEVATEAIALGHDLGHTPFGHAGEAALNEILRSKAKDVGEDERKDLSVPLFGFDHCPHAIEVVSRIEKEYVKEKECGGLDLTFDIRDGILKHMYERAAKPEKPFSTISEVVNFPEYCLFGNNRGSLEAQCVYFADKVTYLLGDIEDGLRSDILKCSELTADPFFEKLSETYKSYRSDTLELRTKDDFVPFRSKVLTTLILNCIDNARSTLCGLKIKDIDGVLSTDERIIYVSKSLRNAWEEFYRKWMKGYLFKNDRVKACEFKAFRIIKELFKAYEETPELIKAEYREHCAKAYEPLGIAAGKILNLITVRNYIAGMTDAFATAQHTRLFMSSEPVTL